MIGRNDVCWCGSRKKWKKCHFPILPQLGSRELLTREYFNKYKIILKTADQIEKIRRACHLTAYILDLLCKEARAGVTTNELNDYANELHHKFGAKPAPLHYGSPPFPKSICTSLNEMICHGIPNDEPLKEGDIMNIDVSVILDGYYGDTSRMVKIGRVSEERERVFHVSKECLDLSIDILKPGIFIYEIGEVIEECAARYQCSVVDQFVGHGVGLYFHESPQVPHHHNHVKTPLAPGMIFTIEPMINAGERGAVIDPRNKWEARTCDGKASAQWEHTLLITEKGHEILTTMEGNPFL